MQIPIDAFFPCSSNLLNGINWILFLSFGTVASSGLARGGK